MSFVNNSEKGRPVTIFDEGVTLTNNVSSIDLTGAGVTATALGTNVTADIPSNMVGPSSLTQGSVLFAGAANVVAQDNANFFWNDSNNRLGLGTASPSSILHIYSSAPVLTLQDSVNSGAQNYIPRIDFVTSTSVIRGRIDFNTTNAGAMTIVNFSGSPNGSIYFATGGSNRMVIDSTGQVGIGTGTTALANPLEVKITNSNAAFTGIQKYSVVDTASGRQDVVTFSGGATSNRGMKINVQELTSGGADTGFGNSGFVFFLNEIRMYHEGAYPVTFYTTNLERGRFAATGEFGLGITSPTAKLHVKQVVATSGTAKSLIIDNFNHTGQTASTEINNVAFNTYTRTWAAGAITMQREVLFDAPTYAFASSSTISVAAHFAISGSPIEGTNATITNAVGLMVGNPLSTVTSTVVGSTFQAIFVPEGIANGVTTVAARVGLLVTSAQPLTLGNQTATLTDFFGIKVESQSLSSTTNTRTITNAASIYIEGAPSNNSNVAFTNGPYSLWVDAGLSRFDGDGTRVLELPADATGNATAATGRVPILVGGNTKYLRYYDD